MEMKMKLLAGSSYCWSACPCVEIDSWSPKFFSLILLDHLSYWPLFIVLRVSLEMRISELYMNLKSLI